MRAIELIKIKVKNTQAQPQDMVRLRKRKVPSVSPHTDPRKWPDTTKKTPSLSKVSPSTIWVTYLLTNYTHVFCHLLHTPFHLSLTPPRSRVSWRLCSALLPLRPSDLPSSLSFTPRQLPVLLRFRCFNRPSNSKTAHNKYIKVARLRSAAPLLLDPHHQTQLYGPSLLFRPQISTLFQSCLVYFWWIDDPIQFFLKDWPIDW